MGTDANSRDSEENTPMHTAFMHFGSADTHVFMKDRIRIMAIIRQLIAHNWEANLFNIDGLAPIHVACLDENSDAIEYMHWINKESQKSVFDFNLKISHKTLNILNNFRGKERSTNDTPLHIAAKLGNYNLILELR